MSPSSTTWDNKWLFNWMLSQCTTCLTGIEAPSSTPPPLYFAYKAMSIQHDIHPAQTERQTVRQNRLMSFISVLSVNGCRFATAININNTIMFHWKVGEISKCIDGGRNSTNYYANHWHWRSSTLFFNRSKHLKRTTYFYRHRHLIRCIKGKSE